MSEKETQEVSKPHVEEEEEDGEVENVDDLFQEEEEEEAEEAEEAEEEEVIFQKVPKIRTSSTGKTGQSVLDEIKAKIEKLKQIEKDEENQRAREEFKRQKFGEKDPNFAETRIIEDLADIVLSHTKNSLFQAELVNNDTYHWIVTVDIKKLGTDTEFYKDSVRGKIKYIKMNVFFSEKYPFAPPYIFIISPRFQQHTGHVTYGGSICIDLITQGKWNLTITMELLLYSILNEMMSVCEGNVPRIDLSNRAPYSFETSLLAFENMARQHNYEVPPWIREKQEELMQKLKENLK